MRYLDVAYSVDFCRGYSAKKIEENMECEIMQVVLEEAREGYDEKIIVELLSNDLDDMESNVLRIQQWIDAWIQNNADVGR
jgi:adenylate kinase